MEATVTEIHDKAEAAIEEKKKPLDGDTATELWQEIRGFVSNVRVSQFPVRFSSETERTGVEMGDLALRVVVGGNVDAGPLKMIGAAATGRGRELVFEHGELIIY